MSAALHLAKPEHLGALLPLVSAFHAETGIDSSEAQREAAIAPLLEGIPYGAVYIIGPTRAPIGYIVVTFSWSVEFGGMDGFVDEIYIRPAVRGRGIATEVLTELPKPWPRPGSRPSTWRSTGKTSRLSVFMHGRASSRASNTS